MPVGLLKALLLAALSVINPRFTPANLVRDSGQILLLRASAPRGKLLEAEVVETLRGQAPAEKKLSLHIGDEAELEEDDVAAAFGEAKAATAILFLSKPGGQAADEPAGALQVGTQWFAVHGKPGKWSLDRDKQELFAVWAGSARMLAEATRYALADAAADFPVRSLVRWGSDAHLGRLKGRANACLAADLGAPVGPCAIVLSEAGDRVYQAARKGEKPEDVTEKLKLATASRLAAVGDFNGDGRLDIASWNGKAVLLSAQGEGGVFAAPGQVAELPECRSLAAMDVGAKAAGLLAGTPAGPVLLIPNGEGRFVPRALAAGGAASGGPCVAADGDGDGRCDIVQVCADAVLFHAGEGPGRFKAAARTQLRLVKSPCVAVCGDYDADGRLDIVVGGDGLALLSRDERGAWENRTGATGELAYHGNANQPRIIGGAPCDINGDGRQSVALFYADRSPMVFFSRGFACFGLARELALSAVADTVGEPVNPLEAPAHEKLKAAGALQRGQAAGTVMDLNGDTVQDLLAVGPDGNVWVLFGQAEREEAPALTVALPPRAAGPATIGVTRGGRRIGTHIVAAGAPAFIGCPEPGEVRLEWHGPDGTPRTRSVAVEKPTRVELVP
ncbi:MAG: VCBS repeat-containing protein [Planctomycetes bacterium]|nr:VCBS repeat-containing protein [Planctomycetota bacterium]